MLRDSPLDEERNEVHARLVELPVRETAALRGVGERVLLEPLVTERLRDVGVAQGAAEPHRGAVDAVVRRGRTAGTGVDHLTLTSYRSLERGAGSSFPRPPRRRIAGFLSFFY